jgi:hypothetical protein
MSLDVEHINQITEIVREFIPDAQPTTDVWHWDFQDHCGCYSEWTTESCTLRTGYWSRSINPKDYKLRQRVEQAVERWAHANLSWNGCECCGNNLYVDVYLFSESPVLAERKW